MIVRFLVLILSVALSLDAVSREFTVIPEFTASPVNSGKCYLYNAHSDSIGCLEISRDGTFIVSSSDPHYLKIDVSGYAQKLINLQYSNSDTIFIAPAMVLKEVVVEAMNANDLGNKISYRIAMADMNRYNNFLQALNEIPNLTVLSSGEAFYEGSDNVRFLLDGVETTKTELQTISKEDILKIEVYGNPPARFLAQGINYVVDVRTKSKLIGGNLGIDITQAFYPIKGENAAAFFYNYKRSRFSIQYTGNNRHYKKYRRNERLSYSFDGIDYNKRKRGLNSKMNSDFNGLTMTFQNNRDRDYLYNLNIGSEWDNTSNHSRQEVSTNLNEFLATNTLKTRYAKYNIANFFEKDFGDGANFGKTMLNINYQHFNTRYYSSYQEFPTNQTLKTMDSESAYKTRLDGIFAEMQYEMPQTHIGYFSFAVFDTYKYSRYVDTSRPFYQKTNYFGGAATWFWGWNRIRWNAVISAGSTHLSSTLVDRPHNTAFISPKVNLSWYTGKAIRVDLEYTQHTGIPTIAQLSETDQWLDTRLVYHGNSSLRQYRMHKLSLKGAMNRRYIDATLLLQYSHTPNMICSQYTLTDRYMLETIVNLDKYNEYYAMADFTLKPLGNNLLTLWNRIILAEVDGKNSEYQWKGHRFQWMSEASLNLDKYTISAFYQYPGKVADGQLIRPRAQCWYISAAYRPKSNLSIGIMWYMPFGKGFKESEYTVGSAPVYFENETYIRDGANYLSLQLTWNVSFGRNQNRARPDFGNEDNDSGILYK